jgi:hypothetical protein
MISLRRERRLEIALLSMILCHSFILLANCARHHGSVGKLVMSTSVRKLSSLLG